MSSDNGHRSPHRRSYSTSLEFPYLLYSTHGAQLISTCVRLTFRTDSAPKSPHLANDREEV